MRLLEVEGLRLNVGLDFIIELTRKFSEKKGEELGIDEAIELGFSYNKLTAEKLDYMITTIETSLNSQRRLDGLETMPHEELLQMLEQKGFAYIGKIIEPLAESISALVAGEATDGGAKKKG